MTYTQVKKTSSSRLGFAAELKVAAILSGSGVEFVNETKESRKPYDLIWNDIKIDVKGTSQSLGVNKKKCVFTANLTEAHTGVILVLVGMLKDRDYYWVKPYTNSTSLYCMLQDAITADDVPQAILEAAGMPVEKITTTNAYAGLNIKSAYAQKLEQLAKQHNRSMANMIEVLIDQELKLPPSQKPGRK